MGLFAFNVGYKKQDIEDAIAASNTFDDNKIANKIAAFAESWWVEVTFKRKDLVLKLNGRKAKSVSKAILKISQHKIPFFLDMLEAVLKATETDFDFPDWRDHTKYSQKL